ncbi:MAG: hypothetical protein AB7D02_02555 [Candidatus Paceibacterota bacterium]
MEKFEFKIGQNLPQKPESSKEKESEEKEKEIKSKIEDFVKKYFESEKEGVKRISLDAIKELKEKGITTEQLLDFLCQERGVLLHGSIYEIPEDKLKSRNKKIYATNKGAIAIMRSLYSNLNVCLEYPYHITEKKPLVLKIHTPPDGKFIKTERGFVYVVNKKGFKNRPRGSWQFIKKADEVEFIAVVETEEDDFKYPVKVLKDYLELKHPKP